MSAHESGPACNEKSVPSILFPLAAAPKRSIVFYVLEASTGRAVHPLALRRGIFEVDRVQGRSLEEFSPSARAGSSSVRVEHDGSDAAGSLLETNHPDIIFSLYVTPSDPFVRDPEHSISLSYSGTLHTHQNAPVVTSADIH